jgi:hypothetical protein
MTRSWCAQETKENKRTDIEQKKEKALAQKQKNFFP